MKTVFFFLASFLIASFIIPAYATTCSETVFSNGTVISCPNQITQTQTYNSPVQVPSSSSVKDYFSTILHKFQSASQESGGNSQFSNMTSEAARGISDTIDLLSIVKYLLASLVGLIAPYIFGQNVPNWIVPLFVWSMVAVTAFSLWKHIWKMVVIGLIIIVAIFIFVLFGYQFIPH